MNNQKNFPNDFTWGTAAAAFQIEGAAKQDGKGKSIWDRFCEVKGKVQYGDNGNIACDHYHRYPEDIALMNALNIQSYRFSVSWPRIFPDGMGTPNKKGIDFYKRLVNSLLEHNISPMLTLYHWDLPQTLQDRGGWENRDVVEYFYEYATYLYQQLGDTVSRWITINEPWVASYLGYGIGEHAPGIKNKESFLKASHHMMLAHARAVSGFRQLVPSNGQIGITLNMASFYSANNDPSTEEAVKRNDGFLNRWFMDPIFKGEYPQDMLDFYENNYNLSFIKDNDLQEIAQPIDFLGINYYSSSYIKSSETKENFMQSDDVPTDRPVTAMGWEVNSQGLFDLLLRIKQEYGDIPLYITENGAAYDDEVDAAEKINDFERQKYLEQHISACHKAIENGVNLQGYYVWSFLDNFEWAFGYQKRFGIVHVDFKTQKRLVKQSAVWYKNIIENNGIMLE